MRKQLKCGCLRKTAAQARKQLEKALKMCSEGEGDQGNIHYKFGFLESSVQWAIDDLAGRCRLCEGPGVPEDGSPAKSVGNGAGRETE